MSFIYDTIRIQNRLDCMSVGKIVTQYKGDIIVDNGTKTTNMSVGTDKQALVADSNADNNLSWKTLDSSYISDFATSVSGNSDLVSCVAHLTNTNNPHFVTKAQIGLSDVENLKVNLLATTDPTVNTDISLGYTVGSRWINTISNTEYVCVNNSTGSAIWSITTNNVDNINLAILDNPTYKTLQDNNNIFFSAGLVSGGLITDAGSEKINVASGSGFIRDSDNSLAKLFSFDWTSSNDITIPTDTVRYVGIEYNSGLPQIVTKTANTWTYNTDFPIGTIVNEDGTLYILYEPHTISDASNQIIQRFTNTEHYTKDLLNGGLLIQDLNGRYLSLSAGTIWSKLRAYPISALDTSNTDTFVFYFRNGSGGWSTIQNAQTWTNNKYDNGSGTLATMTNEYFGVLWIYIDLNGYMSILYGQNEYSNLVNAQSALPISTINLPKHLRYISTLICKLIYVKGASSATSIQDMLSSNVDGGNAISIPNHNDLIGLDGGTDNEYYHLTAQKYGFVNNLLSQAVGISDSQTITNKTISALSNTITNITNSSIKSDAGISATKIANGSVSDTNFQYISSLGSNAVGVDDNVVLTNKILVDSSTMFQNNLDNTKLAKFNLSNVPTNTTITYALPNINTTLIGTNSTNTLTNKTMDFTSNTITNIKDTNVSSIANINVSKLADGSITNSEFTKLSGITDSVVSITDVQVISNKSFVDSKTNFINNDDNTKKMHFDLSTLDPSVNRVITVPNYDLTLVGTTTSQTLTNKSIGSNLNMLNNKIINLADPVSGSDATTKQYVDNVVQGLNAKMAVRVKTVATLPSYTQNGAGFGATLTGSSNGALPQVDGITLIVNDRILIDNYGSVDGSDNGIYVVTQVGSIGGPWILTRATDADNTVANEVQSGLYVFVTEGDNNASNGYILTTPNPIILDTTALQFTQFSGAGQITAGTGLIKSGNILNAIGSATILANADSLEVNSSNTANQILLSSGSINTASTFGKLPLDNQNSVTGHLAISNGGTNTTSFSAGSSIIATNSNNTALEATNLAPSQIVTLTGSNILTNKILTDDTTLLQNVDDNTKKVKFQLGNITTNVTRTIVLPDTNDTLVTLALTQTLTNKTINASNNTISNLANSNIISGAGIDATKIANGSVNNTKFQYINALNSSAVGVSDTNVLTNKSFVDSSTTFENGTDNTKVLSFDLSGLSTSTHRTLTIPNFDTVILGTDSTQVITNKTISATNNTITGLTNSALSISANIDATKIADGSVSNTRFQRINSLNSLATGISDTQTLTNKTLTDSLTYIQNNADNSKKIQFNLDNLTTSTTRTLSLPDSDGIITLTAFAQVLTNKTIDANNNTISNIGNANIKNSANINVNKLANGSITNVEFQYLSGITSSVASISDSQILSNKNLVANSTYFQDGSDDTKKAQFVLSGINTGTTRSITLANGNGTMVLADLAQTLTNKTISALNNTITNISDTEISNSASINATKIANGSVSNTSFQYLSGLLSQVVGVNDVQSLINKTLTSPKILTAINDTNGNELIKLTSVSSAVNEITVSNAVTSVYPSISATGNDTNINLALLPKGSGKLILGNLTLTNTDGSFGQVLKTDGSGNLSFATVPILVTGSVITADATSTTISTIATVSNTTYLLEIFIVGRRTDAGTESAGFVVKSLYRNNAGVLTKVSTDITSGKDVQGWASTDIVSGTNIVIAVQGEISKQISWISQVRIASV